MSRSGIALTCVGVLVFCVAAAAIPLRLSWCEGMLVDARWVEVGLCTDGSTTSVLHCEDYQRRMYVTLHLRWPKRKLADYDFALEEPLFTFTEDYPVYDTRSGQSVYLGRKSELDWEAIYNSE